MKTNFLKTSLSAFAFALAIVASFAFSPALSSTEDASTVQGYTQATGMGSTLTPCNVSINTCEMGTAEDCTVSAQDNTPVYGLEHFTGSTTCLEQLSKVP
ncbi:MAG TPA: DUF6520 family protein [Mariniflexile sp.]